MTPKEKAEELVGKYLAIQFGDFPTTDAKQCALIAVDEIIKAMRKDVPEVGFGTGYWSEVREEIKKL